MDTTIVERHDAVLVDLDGVVYRGDEPIPGAGAVVEKVRGLGIPVLFLTNNSSRTPQTVADRLQRMGIPAQTGEVLTSALATAVMLQKEGAGGKTAFVVGQEGIRSALNDAGISIRDGEPERVDLVVVGWDLSINYAKLRTASLLVQRGARLIATNSDASYPAADGLWPGTGALLAAIVTTTGAVPTIVGKPARPLFEAAVDLTGANAPLVVGDRLDTDVAGAAAMGWDSLLVLSGAARPSDLIRSAHLPTYVGGDLSVLLTAAPPARIRTARPEDAGHITELLEASGLNSEGVQDRLDSTIVSGEGARIDATACVENLGGMGLLRSVAVRPATRGQGLGLLVVGAALRNAATRSARQVSLFTESAMPFFERLGFRRVDRADLPDSVQESAQAMAECAESATAMTLEL